MSAPTPVDTLSPAVRERLGARDVIVFDAVCVLCSGFFRFVYRYDLTQRFRFVTAQSELGTRLYQELGLPTDDYETNLVIVDGRIYQKLDAFTAAMGTLALPWRIASVARYLPRGIRDFLYLRIARNRYAIFGRYDTCMVPDAEVRARFLDGA